MKPFVVRRRWVGDGVPNVYSSGDNTPYNHVVIHSAVMRCEPGGAEALGRMNQTSTTGSWHYATDPTEAIQCSRDSIICWGAPPNPRKIHIEMADYPKPWPEGSHTKAWWHSFKRLWRWSDDNHKAMLEITARLTAELLIQGGLPTHYCTARQLRNGRRGWTTHAQVTAAFHESVHWDPGVWPRRRFGKRVDHYAAVIHEQRRGGKR